MKRYIPFAMLLALASCSLQPIEIDQPAMVDNNAPKKVYHAATESAGSDMMTKVSADQDMKVVWNAGDRISIFELTTYNHPYLFLGDDNDTAGDFEDQTPSGFHTGNRVPYVYAAYPYSRETKMDNRGDLTMNLPAEQSYKSNSFGIGANTMVAVSEGDFLAFKNVGGYISLRLYGNNVAVSSISLKANNGEKIAGKAKISIPLGGVPTTVMDVTATDEVTMVCEPPVTIGATVQDYTSFWFVLPPVTMAGGFTITVTDADGGIFTKSTSKPYVVKRNQLDWMSALQVIPDYIAATIHFADEDFEAYCLENFDRNEDGILTFSEAKLVEGIDVCTDNISSLGGIEYFTNLKTLVCAGSGVVTRSGNSEYTGQLTSLDLSGNPLLETLDCHENQLTTLDLSANPNLESVDCTDNPMTTLTLAPGQFITDLETPEDTEIVHDWDDGIGPESFPDPEFRAYVFDNFDTDHSGILSEAECNAVTRLSIRTQNVFSLEGVEFFQNLQRLDCFPIYPNNNQGSLTSLDVSHNTELERLECYNNQLTSLNVSQNTALTVLNCRNNQLTSLDLCTSLIELNCLNNQLTSLDVSHNTALTSLHCAQNQLTSLNLSTSLTGLDCGQNQLTSLNVSHITGLTWLQCSSNQLTSLDICNSLTMLDCSHNQLMSLDVSNNTVLTDLICFDNQLTSLDVSYDTALTNLFCYSNQLTSLDVSHNTALTWLWCYSNQLTSLDVSHNTGLTSLWCYSNQLTSLDVSHNTELARLDCYRNQLTSLDVSHNTGLTSLQCAQNQLTSLNLSTSLTGLNCGDNQLTSLDVSHNTELERLECYNNQLTSLDVSHNTALTDLRCYNNQLTSLDVSHNTSLTRLSCSCPTMQYLYLLSGQTIANLTTYPNTEIVQIVRK